VSAELQGSCWIDACLQSAAVKSWCVYGALSSGLEFLAMERRRRLRRCPPGV